MRAWLHGATLRRAAIWGATRAPRWFVRSAPLVIGAFLSFILRSERLRVRQNLRRIHGVRPWREEGRNIRRTFVEFARSLTEGLSRDRFGGPEFEVQGAEGIQDLLRSPSGFLVGTFHVGPWDLIVQMAFAESDRRVLVVMAREGVSSAASIHDQGRNSAAEFLRLGSHPLDALPVLSHLADGGIVAVQLDRAAAGGEVQEGSLFGQGFPFAMGPFRLAGLAQVPLVPILSARLGDGRYLVRVLEPLHFAPRPSEGELGRAREGLSQELERHLSRYPTQWFDFRSS